MVRKLSKHPQVCGAHRKQASALADLYVVAAREDRGAGASNLQGPDTPCFAGGQPHIRKRHRLQGNPRKFLQKIRLSAPPKRGCLVQRGHAVPCRDQLVEDCQVLISPWQTAISLLRRGTLHIGSRRAGESRPKVSRDRDCTKTKNSNNDELVDELERLLAVPSPSVDDLFDDPLVRWRIGEWISLAMNRAIRARRRRRRRRRSSGAGLG